MRAAVEKVTFTYSVITEFNSLTGSVPCNTEIQITGQTNMEPSKGQGWFIYIQRTVLHVTQRDFDKLESKMKHQFSNYLIVVTILYTA